MRLFVPNRLFALFTLAVALCSHGYGVGCGGILHGAPSTILRPDSPYDLVKDEEYFAFSPYLRDGSFVPRVVRTRSYFSRHTTLVTQVVTVETRQIHADRLWLRPFIEQLAIEGETRFRKTLAPWVDFAIEQFGRREWKDDFKQRLLQYAQDYAHRSTYFIVREREGFDGLRKILGTMRLISSSYYGKLTEDGHVYLLDKGVPLPLEVYLQRELPRSWRALTASGVPGLIGGEVLEPGNFAVLRGVSDATEREIYAQFLNLLIRPSYGGLVLSANRHLYTYGDAVSLRLYRGKGFEPVADFKPITRDGTVWNVMEASPDDILAAYAQAVVSGRGSAFFFAELKSSLDYFLNTELRW